MYKIGEIAKTHKFNIKVNGTRTWGGDSYHIPEEGYIFFYVDVTFENISNKREYIVPSKLSVVDSDGRSYRFTIAGNPRGSIVDTVYPGRKITGEYIVEITEGIENLEFIYEDSDYDEDADEFIEDIAIFKL